MTRPAFFGAILVASALAFARPALAQSEEEPRPTGGQRTEQDLVEAFQSRDYQGALALLDRQAAQSPKDPFVAYNRACALAMLGRADEAAESLLRALSLGFTDLFHMERDAHLTPLRDHATFRTILRGWRELLDARGAADLESAREALGPTYTYESDPSLRLNFASAMPAESFDAAKREIARVAVWASETVLGPPVESTERPDPWVLVILPTPADFVRLIGGPGIGGYYDRDRKRLVAQDIGPSLRHEFFHVLHWRRMDQLGQQHPLWIMEGLASLLEDVETNEAGGFRIVPSWRTNIAKRLERAGRLTPWPDLATIGRDSFMGYRARANYAQSRAVFMFLLDEGALATWYGMFVERFADDPSGIGAIERALGAPLESAEMRFRQWLRRLPEVGEQARPPRASLGVDLGPGTGDGPSVLGPSHDAQPKYVSQERLRRRDVITAVDGRATTTLDDLFRVLSDLEVGRRIVLDVRRAGRAIRVELELVDRQAAEDGNDP